MLLYFCSQKTFFVGGRAGAAVGCRPRGGGGDREGAGDAGPTATGGAGCRGTAASAANGADLETAWHHPAATAVTRKRLIRAVMREVVARVEDDQVQLL